MVATAFWRHILSFIVAINITSIVSKAIPRYVGLGKIVADSPIRVVLGVFEPCYGKLSRMVLKGGQRAASVHVIAKSNGKK